MKILSIKTIFAIVLAALCASCHTDKDFDYGKVEGHLYTNKYFGMTMRVPDSCLIDRSLFGDIKPLSEIDKEDTIVPKTCKVSEVKAANLIRLFKFKYNKADSACWNVRFLALKKGSSPQFDNDREYVLIGMRITMEDTFYKAVSPVTEEKFGGKTFYTYHVKTRLGDHEDRYTAIIKGFIFEINAVYTTDKDHAEVDRIRRSIVFSEKD